MVTDFSGCIPFYWLIATCSSALLSPRPAEFNGTNKNQRKRMGGFS